MARIRSIHPGLFTDEAFVSLSAEAQILWIGLWCEADDQGVFEWKPTTLKMRILPAATEAIDPLLDELQRANCVRVYAVHGRPYGVIRNFVRHQRPKAPKEVHPLPPEYRAYAGYTSAGTRPNATTGRKRYDAAESEAAFDAPDAPPADDFGGFAPESSSEVDADDVASLRNEFGTSSEPVREFALRWRMEDGGWKEPSRDAGFQDVARVTPVRTHTHVDAHTRGSTLQSRGSENAVTDWLSRSEKGDSASGPRTRPSLPSRDHGTEKSSIAALGQSRPFAGHSGPTPILPSAGGAR